MADRMASMLIVKECLYMTKQCIEAMEHLYALERKTANQTEKAVFDNALDQLLNWTDSERDPNYLVRDAISNARKKVYRYSNRTFDLDMEELNRLVFHQPEIEMIEWRDVLKQANLTERQQLVFRRCEQGYSIKEIALECSVSVKSIYRIRQRARSVILDFMEQTA